MTDETTRTEIFTIDGETLVATVKNLVHEGNIRRVSVQNKDGRTLLEIPLTFGVVGALLLPTLAALGAIAAMVTECKLVVERVDDASPKSDVPPDDVVSSNDEPATE
jgi:hypothetical protein